MRNPPTGDIYGQTVVKVSPAYDRQLKPLGDLALAKLVAQPGDRIVDVGCGAAQTCVQIGEAIGPSGKVIGIDRSPILVEFARKRVEELEQVEIAEGDATTFAFESGTYDALFSRFGVMAFAEPVAAFSNLRGALKSDGRFAFVCWRAYQDNELDYLPFNAAAPHLPPDELCAVEEGAPFSFAEPDAVREVLKMSGFGEVSLTAHDVAVTAGGVDSTLDLCLSAGALGSVIRRRPELFDVVKHAVRRDLEKQAHGRDVFMSAAVWVVTAKAC
ncbi:MAG: class I SAM-dependent methyltransferase [Pseudomonadota bacterium]